MELSQLTPEVQWEYWNGKKWTAIPGLQGDNGDDLDKSTVIRFTVPPDMAKNKVNEEEGYWIRARIVKGGFGFLQPLTWTDAESGVSNQSVNIITQPPALSDFRLGYTWQYGPFKPEHVLAYNDFQYEDQTGEATVPGTAFQPFTTIRDITPALYFGFDKKLPVERLNLFFYILEQLSADSYPPLQWEYWNGQNWHEVSVEDETQDMAISGMTSFIAAEDSQPLARFGTSLHWLRARLKEDGPPPEPEILSLFLNAVWASQWQTIVDDPLGASSGQPTQVFQFRQIPLLAGERIEVRELAGARANTEWRSIALQLFSDDDSIVQLLEERLGQEGPQTEIEEGDLRLVRDRSKKVIEVWVRYHGRPHFLNSISSDRHYLLDHITGRLSFSEPAKVPPPGATILARRYRTGGGRAGNVPVHSITQLQAAIGGVENVFNPIPAEGGADAQTIRDLLQWGGNRVHHRGRALQSQDYETMAREASAAVAFARTISTKAPFGPVRPGHVTVLIIPHSNEPRPQPSYGLRTHVGRYIEARAPADLAALQHVHVIGPRYLPVDIAATMVPIALEQAGEVVAKSRAALEAFLHPLFGGPGGHGWDLGRDVFLSDIASVLERIDGVDFVEELTLLRNAVPQGERYRVASDEIAVAGAIRLKVKR